MTVYTRSDLATRVLKDLGLCGADETPSGADQAWAEETVESEAALLVAKGIPVVNGNDQALPHGYLTALSRRIGLAIGPSFGLFSVAEAEQAMPLAEANLRILCQTGPTGEVLQAEHF